MTIHQKTPAQATFQLTSGNVATVSISSPVMFKFEADVSFEECPSAKDMAEVKFLLQEVAQLTCQKFFNAT